MALDKLEAVKKVSETLSKQQPITPAEEMQQMASNKEHFQSLIESKDPLKAASFERVDTKAFASEVQTVETEKNPIFAEENVSSQKSGSSTDQERKRKQSQTQEIEEVGATTRSKKTTSASKSLMDEVGKLHKNVSKMSQLSPDAIRGQAKDLIAQLDKAKTQLSQTQGEIKPSYQTLLRNRLTHIDDNLKIALSKAGVEYTPPPATGKGNQSPVHRFIHMLSDGQHQLESLDQTIEKLNMTGAQISPANMLAIQIKMNYIQQQIELFTSLLNKALESTKTIMNVQV